MRRFKANPGPILTFNIDLSSQLSRIGRLGKGGEEYERACHVTLQITGKRRLLDQSPVRQRSIAVRNPYFDPLSFLQVELLARRRQKDGKTEPGDGDREKLLYATLLTINGFEAGLPSDIPLDPLFDPVMTEISQNRFLQVIVWICGEVRVITKYLPLSLNWQRNRIASRFSKAAD